MSDNITTCDKCGEDKECKILPVLKDSNAILCVKCFGDEMKWRRQRIHKGVIFDLPNWKDLKDYKIS
jgi:hypothetical protein